MLSEKAILKWQNFLQQPSGRYGDDGGRGRETESTWRPPSYDDDRDDIQPDGNVRTHQIPQAK